MNRSGKFKTSAFTRIIFAVALTGLIAALATAAIALMYLNSGESVDFARLRTAAKPPEIYAANGELAKYCARSDSYATYDEIPDIVKDAFIAVEDKRFWSHNGIDYIRMAGAALKNIKSGSFAEGGSTITQQLAKNIYLSSEKSLERKIKEARIAVTLEKNFSKEQLLEYYLNMLYFGNGEYGVKNAARRYFGKSLDKVSLLEAAMLAATVKAPSKVNPLNDLQATHERALIVLDLMHEQGLIDDNTHSVAQNAKIVIKNELNENNFDQIYLANALAEASSILGISEKELVAKGYKVFTYLDYDKLDALVKSIDGSETHGIKAGLSADVNNYALDAVYADFALDLAGFARQSGSALKPLVAYAPAFECGILSPAGILDDSRKSFGDYSPSNYGDIYYGDVSARRALSLSLNVPAVQTLQSIGVDEGAAALASMGIDAGDNADLALALGATQAGVSFPDLLGGYTTLASGGDYARLALVSAIFDADDNAVYRRNIDAKPVFSPQTSYLITDCLVDCACDGTAKKLSPLGFTVAAKTGTVGSSEGNHDAYCVAYTPSCAALFWTGSPDYSQFVSDTGGGTPTIFAREFFDVVGSGGEFKRPDGITQVRLDAYDLKQGKLTIASPYAPRYACETELFTSDRLPVDVNTTFDRPSAANARIEYGGDAVTIAFDADPRLCYRVIKKGFLSRDSIVADISDREGVVTVSDGAYSLFPPSYAIIPYYLDDRGEETVGEVVVLRQ